MKKYKIATYFVISTLLFSCKISFNNSKSSEVSEEISSSLSMEESLPSTSHEESSANPSLEDSLSTSSSEEDTNVSTSLVNSSTPSVFESTSIEVSTSTPSISTETPSISINESISTESPSISYEENAVYEGFDGYYSSIKKSLSGAELKTALGKVIRPHTTLSYNSLWEHYHTTDVREDGTIWDMYSSITPSAQCGNYSKEGSCYNREHSMPKSWFNNQSPMNTDIYHIVPTDGYVNNRRSNYPFGEVGDITYSSKDNFSKLGHNTFPGYSGIVFEPNDEYKGDFARIYFYMVTCYDDIVKNWSTANTNLGGTQFPGLSEWSTNMLLKWAIQDPVSEKEINRNNTVYSIQGNRNPYVDFPELQYKVFGNVSSYTKELLKGISY